MAWNEVEWSGGGTRDAYLADRQVEQTWEWCSADEDAAEPVGEGHPVVPVLPDQQPPGRTLVDISSRDGVLVLETRADDIWADQLRHCREAGGEAAGGVTGQALRRHRPHPQ